MRVRARTTALDIKCASVRADVFRMDTVGFLVFVGIVAAIVWLGGVQGRDRQRRLTQLCARAGLEFSALDPFIDTTMLPFPLFTVAHASEARNVVWDERDEGLVRVFDHSFRLATGETVSVGMAVSCGLVTLPFSVPPIDLFVRGGVRTWPTPPSGQSVTLELDAFNERFDVRAIDARAATAFLDQRMMGALLRLPLRVEVHVREDRMLCVAKQLKPAEVLLLLRAAQDLRHRLPQVMKSLYPPRPKEGPYEHRWLQGSWSPDPTSADTPEPS